jgi:light-harvesting complex I chlorophyll a/b binding protein 2
MAAAIQAALSTPAVCRSSFVSGRQLRASRVQAASRKVSLAVVAEDRPLWFPGSTAPEWLDGSLPADYGFDPLGLSSEPELKKWMVQAELVHCRWAMLGAAGILIPDFLTQLGLLNVPFWYTAGDLEYFADAKTLFAVELLFMGWAEGRRWADILNPGSVSTDPIFSNNKLNGTEVGYPGFNPLGLPTDKKMKAKEIANGRLAMLAVAGFWVQAKVTGVGPTANLFAHLSDPGHVTIFQTLSN